ncbi:hypothetical protein ERO13_A11G286523v2 [Gossypium hirsutum]|uniref:Uncharacterized protein n=1 Tax=Gossypium darwinii TaxID=34276 RepID=A0A5D2ESN9_GOSDA|nr:hypothetical protein ERO13_A11G286523v2 [Gossypium hirsutum]TYG96297.1 hypothetical protein ES288_A11G338700v1 [Gossypium darwinii]
MVTIVETLKKKEDDHKLEDEIVTNIVKIIIPGGFEDILWWDFILDSLNDMRLPKSLIWNVFKPFQLKVTNGSPSNCLEMCHKFRICFSPMTFFSSIKQT